MFSCSKLRRWTESVSFLVRQINEVCIRLFGTVTFLSYAIIIHTLSLLYFYYLSKCCNICLSLQYFVHITISHCLLYDNGEFVLYLLNCGTVRK